MSSRLGAARIDGLSVAQSASATPEAANTAIVARADTASSKTLARREPSGAMTSAIVRQIDSEHSSRRSGVIAMRYPYTMESVDGIASALGIVAAVRT